MDDSLEYMKQCEKAPKEITKLNWLAEGTGYCTYHKKLLRKDYDSCWECEDMQKAQWDILGKSHKSESDEERKWRKLQKSDDWCEGKYWIQLPRQDELQEMVLFNKTPCQLSSDFYHWHTNQSWDYPNMFTSMEKLWLAFVMSELYHKKWSNGEWIEGDNI